jgi:hypothetical protein
VNIRVLRLQLGLLDTVEITIGGDIDLRRFFGIDDRVRAGFNSVRIRVYLGGPEVRRAAPSLRSPSMPIVRRSASSAIPRRSSGPCTS